jgi:hypothetical protein
MVTLGHTTLARAELYLMDEHMNPFELLQVVTSV